jgi:RecA-family ATPase
MNATPIRRGGLITAAELQGKIFPPVRWVVPDLIPDGLAILAGAPKLGKSWLVLDVALAVTRGGFTLGDRHCQTGAVLYAALEDGERRLQDRMGKRCGPHDWPPNLTFTVEMPNLAEGGVEFLRLWIASAPDPRLIVVDTFAKVRPAKGRDETAYDSDYRAAGILKALADETGVGIVLVHHVRKLDAEDPLETVSGTNGLTGAVDTILVLKKTAAGATLYARGRDIEEAELAVQFDRTACRWNVLGDAGEVRLSDERRAILDALRAAGEPIGATEIAEVTGHPSAATRKLLARLSLDGDIVRAKRGRYRLPE